MLQVRDGRDRVMAHSGAGKAAQEPELPARPDSGSGSEWVGLSEPGSAPAAEQGAQTPPQVPFNIPLVPFNISICVYR